VAAITAACSGRRCRPVTASPRAISSADSRRPTPLAAPIWKTRTAGSSAVVGELQVGIHVGALEQRDDGLEVVAALARHAQLVSLDLRLDALGALVADDLRHLLRRLAAQPLLDQGLEAVLLAGRLRLGAVLAGVERLQRDAALDELGL